MLRRPGLRLARGARGARLGPSLRLAAVVAAAALLAVSCSDATTQMQHDLRDPGYDPNVLTVLAPPEFKPILKQLDIAFLRVRPNTSMSFLSDVFAAAGKHRKDITATPTQEIRAGAAPALWIDLPSVLARWRHDPRVQGPARLFASVPLVLIVRAGNPAHVTGLDVFAKGGPTAARCWTTQPCGKASHDYLIRQGVAKPSYEKVVPHANQVASLVRKGIVDAALVFATDTSLAGLATVPIPSPPTRPYDVLQMSSYPTADEFLHWLATSSDARAILAAGGLVPPLASAG